MEDEVYLVVGKKKVTRMTKGIPGLVPGEFAIHLKVRVSDRNFNRIIPSAVLEIDDSYLVKPDIEVIPISDNEDEDAEGGGDSG